MRRDSINDNDRFISLCRVLSIPPKKTKKNFLSPALYFVFGELCYSLPKSAKSNTSSPTPRLWFQLGLHSVRRNVTVTHSLPLKASFSSALPQNSPVHQLNKMKGLFLCESLRCIILVFYCWSIANSKLQKNSLRN